MRGVLFESFLQRGTGRVVEKKGVVQLEELDLVTLPPGALLVAVLLEEGGAMTIDQVAARLYSVGVNLRGGTHTLRRAASALPGVRRSAGLLSVDVQDPQLRRVLSRLERARRDGSRVDRRASPTTVACSPATPVRTDALWLGTRRRTLLRRDDSSLDLLLWFDPSGQTVRAFNFVASGCDSDALAVLLEQAIHRPLAGCAPATPRCIAVDMPHEQESLASAACSRGIELVSEADFTPLAAVFSQVEQFAREDLSPSSGGVLTLSRFHELARLLWRLSPWRGVRLEEVLRIDGLDPTPIYVLLLANPPEGFTVFLDEEVALDTLLHERISPSSALMVRFYPRPEVPSVSRLADALGWEGSKIPVPLRVGSQGTQMAVHEEIVLLISVMEAISQCVFERPWRDRELGLDGGVRVCATWPLQASHIGRRVEET